MKLHILIRRLYHEKKGPVALRQAVNPLRAWRLPTSQKTYVHNESVALNLYAHVNVLVCGRWCAFIRLCVSVYVST